MIEHQFKAFYFFTNYVVCAPFILLYLLWKMVRHPVLFFKRTRRAAPPSCLLDPSLGKHEYVKANGIRIHCVISGSESKPLMLFLHGFPDFWFSWRHQIREFSKDYRVVAIDMRGYGETDRPPSKVDYIFATLRQDIMELIGALGYSTCTLVGHDWGGAIAWSVVQKYPELIDKFVVMNCPHPRVFTRTFAKSCSQLMKSWYMLFFQVPWVPEFLFSYQDYKYFNTLRGEKTGADDLEAHKYVFSQPGALTGPINYYRCLSHPLPSEDSARKIDVPMLIIWGDRDPFLHSDLADCHGDFVTHLTVKHIPDCSHWVQQDESDLVNQYMREFLQPEVELVRQNTASPYAQ